MYTKFKCVVCGKLTTGRMPRESRHLQGDTSARFPRRHKDKSGNPCPGNIMDAEWVNVLGPTGERTANARRISGCVY